MSKPEGYREALNAAIQEAKPDVEGKREVDGLFISPSAQPAEEPKEETQSLGALTIIEPSSKAAVPADETPEETAVREMNDRHAVISNLGRPGSA